jgi:amino acid transporter
MSTGIIGVVQYLGFYFPHLSWLAGHLIGLGVVVIILAALYRRIESIRVLTTGLWAVMLVTVVAVIAACMSHFSAHLAFTYPAGAFYLGYNTVAYMGDEMKNPGRTMPRAIIYSIFGMMAIYLILNIGVVGVVPWPVVAKSTSVASLAVTTAWGPGAARLVTGLIIITAVASVLTGLLGGSRVPFHAARDKVFFAVFGRLHPRFDFPHVALLVMGVITAAGSFLTLTTVINMLTAVAVLVQSAAQIVALTVLRRRQPGLHRPYRQWLYPVPSLLAMAGWLYVYKSATGLSIILSLAWIVGGLIAFLGWARLNDSWPFAPVRIEEAYLELQDSTGDPDVAQAPV